MFICLTGFASVSMSICMSVCPFVCLSILYQSVCFMSICLSVRLSYIILLCWSVFLFVVNLYLFAQNQSLFRVKAFIAKKLYKQ